MLTTAWSREGIEVTDKKGNKICLIRYTADGVYMLDECDTGLSVCPYFKSAEFMTLSSAEYAALIMYQEIQAQ